LEALIEKNIFKGDNQRIYIQRNGTLEQNCIQVSHLNIDVAPHDNFVFYIEYCVLNLHRQCFTSLT